LETPSIPIAEPPSPRPDKPAFWPYKKTGSASAFLTWPKPPYWDEIIAYGQVPGNSSKTASRIAARPARGHARAAFQGLLDNVRFARCAANPGYIKALNLTVP
jgi:hypothetical protein